MVRCDKKLSRQSDWWGSARDYLSNLPVSWRGPMSNFEGHTGRLAERTTLKRVGAVAAGVGKWAGQDRAPMRRDAREEETRGGHGRYLTKSTG